MIETVSSLTLFGMNRYLDREKPKQQPRHQGKQQKANNANGIGPQQRRCGDKSAT